MRASTDDFAYLFSGHQSGPTAQELSFGFGLNRFDPQMYNSATASSLQMGLKSPNQSPASFFIEGSKRNGVSIHL